MDPAAGLRIAASAQPVVPTTLKRQTVRYDEATDDELIRRVAAQDRRAFEELYHRHARPLGGYLWKLLRQHDLVEEALDDTLLVVWQKAGSFDHRARLSTWMFGIAHNKALKALEKVRRHASRIDSDAEVGEVLSHQPAGSVTEAQDPERSLLRRDQLRMLARAIETLSPEQRAVVELTFFEGRSYAEISEITSCPVNTVKTRMFHARKHLNRRVTRASRALEAE